jgi:hypothetical protein
MINFDEELDKDEYVIAVDVMFNAVGIRVSNEYSPTVAREFARALLQAANAAEEGIEYRKERWTE